ncbi:hypothetical protein RDWZM_006618 [Blomia tropicalis]|uniref:Uncharacterized protein n=1 Tax=Blomia tropicalis TaxID=40697 RepID=A0A9Q0RNK1_BLOTA|nr:hypothetical protein RDWZM_006618 [Blomia tropicalis]
MDKTLTQKNLNLVRWFGEEEKMDSPLGFCLGIENQLLVTDTGNNRVVIFDITTAKFGEQLFFFNSIGVEEPGDVAVHNNHYYVCDFRGHAIGVFNQYGDLVRKIGTEHSGGFLNYPNGIDISNDGEILVGDSHGNQFNLNIFKSDTGKLISSFRCPNLKVSGCVGLKCTQDGWLVTLSKKFSSVLIMDTVLIRVDD